MVTTGIGGNGSGVSLLLPTYDHDALEQVLRDRKELWDSFAGWRTRYTEWMGFAFPMGPRATRIASLGTFFQNSTIEEVEDRRSKYVSSWVPSRGRALTNLRLLSKTNVLPSLYTDQEDTKAGEALVALALGIFGMLDDQKIEGMGGFSFDQQLKQMLTWTGKVAFQPRVFKKGEGIAGVQVRFHDPFNLAHDIDTLPGDRHRLVREFEIPWADVPKLLRDFGGDAPLQVPMPGDKKPADLVKCVDYWLRQPKGEIHHAILVNEQPIRSSVSWVDPDCKRLPIVVVSNPAASHGFVGVKDKVAQSVGDTRIEYHAEPFYAPAIPELVFLQGLESLQADNAVAALPIFLSRMENGSVGGKETSDLKPFAVLKMAEGEQLEELRKIAAGLTTIDTAVQRVYGRLNDIFSDYLVGMSAPATISSLSWNAQYIATARAQIATWSRCDEAAKRELIRIVIDQHKNRWPSLAFNLTGILPEGGQSPYGRRFGTKDYPKGEFDIDIREPAEIPGQSQANEASAVSLTQAGVIDMRTARVVKLGMSQPDKVQEQVDREAVHNSAENQNLLKLQHWGNLADEKRADVKKYEVGTNAHLAAVTAALFAERWLEAQTQALRAAPLTGYTMPQEPGNPSPAVNPPGNTLENPAAAAVAAGRPPTGTQGRPRPKGQR